MSADLSGMRAGIYYAHSANALGAWQTMREHASAVGAGAASRASAFGAGEEAALAGILHDLGKYGDLFQRRLRGEAHGIDHWSAGAWAAFICYRSVAAALCIQGHHIGLQRGDKESLRGMNLDTLARSHPLDLTLSDVEVQVLMRRLAADGFVPQKPSMLALPALADTASAMLDVRMLYSTLVDADFVDTETHMKAGTVIRRPGPALNAVRALDILNQRMNALQLDPDVPENVLSVRKDLWDTCVAAGAENRGLWTLTAPTGAGKTLAMLGFALRHAARHGLRRVVMVIPYLSIIDQTAAVFRAMFDGTFGEGYIIEHHSMAQLRKETEAATGADRDAEEEPRRREKLLAENWDAPVVITTSVQMLESLFTNRPSAARKLHALANSVVLFDEVQTVPAHLAVPTLQTLSRLAERYGSTVVFATATQPAFSHLDRAVRETGNRGWVPAEIVAPSLDLFDRMRRTRVTWPELDSPMSWDDLTTELARLPQVLCVLNLKRHALDVARRLREAGADGVMHLSTSLCPAHRRRVLDTIRDRLHSQGNPGSRRGRKVHPCRLIATQCIEAGVDVDFPVAYRAFCPLDSVAQAAGRCNRNGRAAAGNVIVFIPEEDRYPLGGGYEQAAQVTRALLGELGPDAIDIHDPSVFDRYFRRLYDIVQPGVLNKEFREAISRQDFVEVARLYRLISTDTVNVLVPYPKEIDLFDELWEEARARGLNANWAQRARPLTINLFRPKSADAVGWLLEPVKVGNRESSDWFIYSRRKDYDEDFGLIPPDKTDLLMA